MSKQAIEFHSPGNHVRLEYRKDGQLHILLNKETIAKIDVEYVHDMTCNFLIDTRCTRPGVRRRAAKLTGEQPF